MGCNQSSVKTEVVDNKQDERNVAAEAKVKEAMRHKRRIDIFSEGFDPNSDFRAPTFDKSAATAELLRNALQAHFLFSGLDETRLNMVVGAFEQEEFKSGNNVIEQGDVEAEYFYVLERGSCNATVDATVVKSYSAGGSFGELALLYNAPRAATVVATSQSSVWRLQRNTFRHALASADHSNSQRSQDALSRVKLLQGLSPDQLARMADAATVQRFPDDQRIITKGEQGDVFYFLLEGQVELSDIPGKDGSDILDANSDMAYFGERALITNEPRACNVTAKRGVVCICLDRKDFHKQLGELQGLLDQNLRQRVLENLALLSILSPRQIAKAARACKVEKFEAGDTIVRQGEVGDKFYMIRDGVVDVLKDESKVASLTAGDHFGEQALMESETRSATVTATNHVECFSLGRTEFSAVLGSQLKDALTKAAAERKNSEAALGGSRFRTDIKFQDLKSIALLGTGTFGRVKLVKLKGSGETFALKIMQKAQIVEYKQQHNVLNEKNVMLEARHPFILQLVSTFQDQTCIYMLMELCLGGELFSFLHYNPRNGGRGLSSKDTLFYASGVLDGLAYLHDRKICYRDLKPENLLIDEDGYIKIVDFGFAKVINGKTYTLCGTPEYLAPEIVLSKGYGKGVDYWALGILIYEMRYSYSPFAQDIDVNDHVQICRNIVKGDIRFPSGQSKTPCAKVIRRLLTQQQNQRLGCLADGANDIRAHPFFQSMDFAALLGKNIAAPWVPEIKGGKDTSHFDPIDDGEDIRPYGPGGRYYDNSGWDESF